jgi:hypothetical protein
MRTTAAEASYLVLETNNFAASPTPRKNKKPHASKSCYRWNSVPKKENRKEFAVAKLSFCISNAPSCHNICRSFNLRHSYWSGLIVALSFPNLARSYDSKNQCVRFVGYDGMFQVFFSIAIAAISNTRLETEEDYLKAFDGSRAAILTVATRKYTSSRTNIYALTPNDFP